MSAIKMETVAEFLARGGKITKVSKIYKPKHTNPAPKSAEDIDTNSLPSELLKFLIKKN